MHEINSGSVHFHLVFS